MNKQQSNQMASLRKKLIAAIAMLLVACIMTVSSTYAWFTLSTAPEVKGISTTVGANGNLEMALGYVEYNEDGTVKIDTFTGTGEANDPASAAGNSFAATENWLQSNITWGNLVDLSDGYGLSLINLYPTRLNLTDTALNVTNPLKFPVYGADGRISTLNSNTLFGKYNNVNGFEYTPGQPHYGVSAIGAAASMSSRAFAILSNKAAAITNRTAAINAAKESINSNAGNLASLALKHQESDDAAEVTAEEMASLNALVSRLTDAKNYISAAMVAELHVMLAGSNLTAEEWEAAVSAIQGLEFDAALAALETYGADLTAFSAYKEAYSNIKTTLTGATLSEGASTWGDVETVVGNLLNASGIKILTHSIEEVKSAYASGGLDNPLIADLVAKALDKQLYFVFNGESGIFADIAEFTGPYQSSMTFPSGTKVSGMDLHILGNQTVKVEVPTDAPADGVIQSIYDSAAIQNAVAPEGDDDAVQPLTDTYGYAINLLFRTNAADSQLQLQTDAVNRVYEDKTDANLATMGSGSNMTFTTTSEYTQEKINDLAEGIRVVFYQTNGTILGVAVLDTSVHSVTGDAYKLNLKLVNYTIEDIDSSEGEEFALQLTKDTDGNLSFKDDIALCDLTSNVKTAVSALVYLDGDVIDNSDAGLFANLQATLNLQFSSSAALVPMDNNELKDMVKE